MTTVCVFGGTGFLGRRLVQRLAAEGATLRIAVRSPDRARHVLGALDPQRVTAVRADVGDPDSIAAAVAGVDAIVNAVSAYVEKRGVTFRSVHVQGARNIALEAASAGVARLVLVSGIGANVQSTSRYIRARGGGELVVREAFPSVTVVRPSVMFGPGDALFAGLADLVRLLPVVPLVGGGHTRMQPVFVDDVAEAVARILATADTAGLTYELVGPHTYTLRELIGFALRLIDKRRRLVPLPFGLAELQARFLELLPRPPLTTSQVDLLKSDNLASGSLPGFRDLGITPKAIEDVVPTYLGGDRSTL